MGKFKVVLIIVLMIISAGIANAQDCELSVQLGLADLFVIDFCGEVPEVVVAGDKAHALVTLDFDGNLPQTFEFDGNTYQIILVETELTSDSHAELFEDGMTVYVTGELTTILNCREEPAGTAVEGSQLEPGMTDTFTVEGKLVEADGHWRIHIEERDCWVAIGDEDGEAYEAWLMPVGDK